MSKSDLIKEIAATYQKHGWRLRRVLLRVDSRKEAATDSAVVLGEATVRDSPVDAMWFSRPSHNNAEAWELRLLAETPYALFEKFRAEELEEAREEKRKQMEDRLSEYVSGP